MRILLISDTHGSQRSLVELVEQEEDFDLCIHMGDAEGDEEEIAAIVGCPMEIVRGNNDYNRWLDREKLLNLGKHTILMTHGHGYALYHGYDELVLAARKKGADTVFFGHTHRPMLEQVGPVLLVNPGSLTYPRQMGRCPTYIVAETDKNGELTYKLKEL